MRDHRKRARVHHDGLGVTRPERISQPGSSYGPPSAEVADVADVADAADVALADVCFRRHVLHQTELVTVDWKSKHPKICRIVRIISYNCSGVHSGCTHRRLLRKMMMMSTERSHYHKSRVACVVQVGLLCASHSFYGLLASCGILHVSNA